MSVYCSCEYEPEPGHTVWFAPKDFKPLQTKRRQRCKACGELIDIGSDCLEFQRVRIPDTDVECAIYGEDGEIPRASHYVCEECGGLWLSLYDLGLCVDYDCDQRENVAEFNDMKEARLQAEQIWRDRFANE